MGGIRLVRERDCEIKIREVQNKGGGDMTWAYSFILGVLLGFATGVLTMALVCAGKNDQAGWHETLSRTKGKRDA